MKKVVALIGPTASYKSYFSIKAAKKLNLDIINGDSVQIHKDLNIGSAKLSAFEMQNVKHHLIDRIEADDKYSVFDFQNMVRAKIEDIKYPFIVGGTGLYIKSVLYDYRFIKEELNSVDLDYANYDNFELYNILKSKDEALANKYHPNNRRRVLRALQILNNNLEKTENKDVKVYDSLVIFIDVPRKLLYEHIDKRVIDMINKGLVEEVKGLKEKNIYINAIGYKEIYEYLDNKVSLDEAIENIKKNTRHFAKRQITFFKNQFLDAVKIDFDYTNIEEVSDKITSLIKEFFSL